MKLQIKTTNIELTEAIRSYIEEKILLLKKFLVHFEKNQEVFVQIEVGKTTNHHKKGEVFRAEANLDLIPNTVLRAESVSDDLYFAINDVRNKLEKQIEVYKAKLEARI